MEQSNARPQTILSSPLFLLGLCLLLLNDLYLKAEFGNVLTGKLSDIAGLFIFPLFLTAFFPRYRFGCFLSAACFFIFWKLPASEFLLEWLNETGIPAGRTIDYTDFFALAILPLAWFYRPGISMQISPVLVSVITFSAFCATSMPPSRQATYVNINKTYGFDFSKKMLISKLNGLSAKKVAQYAKHVELHFDTENNLFRMDNSYRFGSDTVAILLSHDQITEKDTIRYKTVLADFLIEGNDSTSSLTFLTAYKVIPLSSDKDYREKAIKEFEKEVIRKLHASPP